METIERYNDKIIATTRIPLKGRPVTIKFGVRWQATRTPNLILAGRPLWQNYEKFTMGAKVRSIDRLRSK
jgi:hypothetical protein